jgi:hypothetical protein
MELVGYEEKMRNLIGLVDGSMDKLHAFRHQYNTFQSSKLMPEVPENIQGNNVHHEKYGKLMQRPP